MEFKNNIDTLVLDLMPLCFKVATTRYLYDTGTVPTKSSHAREAPWIQSHYCYNHKYNYNYLYNYQL